MRDETKGFTLIELIVTIAILAILVTAVVVALNPAEQLARSRDSKRTTDLDSLRSAWNFYLAQATSTDLDGVGGSENDCRPESGTGGKYYMNTSVSTSTPSGFSSVATSTSQTVGSTGWAPARIDQTPGGAPVSNLPIDPVGTASGDFFYAYACRRNKTFEFTARLESSYFKDDLNVDGGDGGNSTTTYEIGSDLTIIGGGN